MNYDRRLLCGQSFSGETFKTFKGRRAVGGETVVGMKKKKKR